MFSKDHLHHAYFLKGDTKEISRVRNFLEAELNVQSHGNPDFWHGTFDTFGIKESRLLFEMQSRRSLSGGRKFFLISTNTITTEAQNALLKVFEEPTENTHFFLIMPSATPLLQTLQSRLSFVSLKKDGTDLSKNSFAALARDFKKAGVAERLKIAKKLADAYADEEYTKADIISFLSEVERVSFKGWSREHISRNNIQSVIDAKKYLSPSGASVKMILEGVAVGL